MECTDDTSYGVCGNVFMKEANKTSTGWSRPNRPDRKDVIPMSFVALVNNGKGIVGIADGKFTRQYPDGYLEEEKERRDNPKLFKNNEFIFVTHGTNELIVNKNKIRIEDWIKDNLTDDIKPQIFFEKLIETVHSDPIDFDNPYFFDYGSRDEKGYYIRTLKIEPIKGTYEFGDKLYDLMSYGGSKWYGSIMGDYIGFNSHDSLEQIAEKKKIQFQSLIAIYDTLSGYNPVGGTIKTEIFTKDEA